MAYDDPFGYGGGAWGGGGGVQWGGFMLDPYQVSGFGPVAITGSYAFPDATGLQLSVGSIVDDLGGWIRTTAGELLQVVVNELGQRIVRKTGEVLSGSPLGPASGFPYGSGARTAPDYTPLLIGGGLLILALALR